MPVDITGKLHYHLLPILINLLVMNFCVDTCHSIFETKQLLDESCHGKIVNVCKCSCFLCVEGVNGITVLGKLQNEC